MGSQVLFASDPRLCNKVLRLHAEQNERDLIHSDLVLVDGKVHMDSLRHNRRCESESTSDPESFRHLASIEHGS